MTLTRNESAVYDMLVMTAKRGEPCPTNRVIGLNTGISERSASSNVLSLRAKGRIVLHGGAGSLRCIEIPSLGVSTRRTQHSGMAIVGKANDSVDDAMAAKRGCKDLLRRQLETGKHWITCPDLFRAACESVGLGA